MPQIVYCLTVLQDTLSRMNKTSQPRTELEMALIRMGSPEMDRSTEAIEARLDRLEKALASGVALKAPKGAKAASVKEDSEDSPQQEEKAVEISDTSVVVDIPDIPKEKVQPFPQWAQVLEQLSSINRPLCGALVDSKAYLHGELVLIDCESKFFLSLIRSDEQAKKAIHQAFIAATGRDFRMGPFHKDKYAVAKDDGEDPMNALLSQMQNAGVDVVTKQ
jgi:DNA polymerase-3 subunit gamma/tau